MNLSFRIRFMRRHVARGLSIIELMVGLVVGLLVSLAAVSSAQLFNATQRQGVSVGSGNANVASALASIKNDLANGGLGFFGDRTFLCNTINLSVNGTTLSNGAAFAPVQATRVASNDRLDVAYASNVIGGVAAQLYSPSAGASAALKSQLPVVAGQSVLLASSDTTANPPCVMRTVTAASAPTLSSRQELTFGNTGANNQVAFTTNPTFPRHSWAALIGDLRWSRYELNGTNLRMTNVITGATATLLRNVIGFRVVYGVSAVVPAPDDTSIGNTGTVINWVKTTTAGWGALNGTNTPQVKALRIAVVVRSPQREKNCDASASKPTLWGDLGITADVIEPDVADWQCYRYRTQIVVAPMRNLVYGQ